MADEFDDFLVRALSPVDRDPDRAFVARVQAQILLRERLRAERRTALSSLAFQIVAIAALAAAVLWVTRSPAVAAFASDSPAVLMLILIAAFSLAVLLIGARPAVRQPKSSFSRA